MRHVILYLVGSLIGLMPIVRPETVAYAAKKAQKKVQKPTLPERILSVPIVRQEEDFSCGPAAMRAVLQYFGAWDGREQQLYKVLETTPEQGTLPENLAMAARRFGLVASIEQPMSIDRLRTLLSAGKLIILELQAWRDDEKPVIAWRDNWEDGHYVVLVGLDGEFAYFMDPSTRGAYTYLPLAELLERWHDYNPVRKDPRERRDLQLGVVISGAGRSIPAKPATRRLLRLD